jgi:hypothetical protein
VPSRGLDAPAANYGPMRESGQWEKNVRDAA